MHSKPTTNKSVSKGCSFNRWVLLLDGDESSPGFLEALSHVEDCHDCQQRVEFSATEDTPWWGEAKQSWLDQELLLTNGESSSSSIVIEIEPEMPGDSRIEFESIALSFLDPPSHPELLGRLGRYEIERVIGKGGMGIVLKAHDTELRRVVAIKVMATHLADSVSARKRFAREAQAAAAVLHPNVIPIYDVESECALPYLVMQFVSGSSLQSKVDRQGPLALADVLRIAKQTAAGLAAAHYQGLVHRDVKPANILLEDSVDRVLLSDFGLARAVDDASLTRTGVIAGTPHYMSPEQARGDVIDTLSDQFSLGSVMYFMLAGRPPFRATSAMGVLNRICTEKHRSIDQLNSETPIEVVRIVDRLMQKKAADRFQSMHLIERELEKLLAALQNGGLSLSKRKRKHFGLLKSFAWCLVAFVAVVSTTLTWVALTKTEPYETKEKNELRPIDVQVLQESLQSLEAEDRLLSEAAVHLQSSINRTTELNAIPTYLTDPDFDMDSQFIQRQIDVFKRRYPSLNLGDE